MRVSGNFYVGVNPAFGDNIGFIKYAKKLQEDITPGNIESLAAHSKTVEKTDEFMKEVDTILEDKKTKKVVIDLIKEYLNLD